MTQEEFKKILKERGIKFTQEGETIVISNENGYVSLDSLQTVQQNIDKTYLVSFSVFLLQSVMTF